MIIYNVFIWIFTFLLIAEIQDFVDLNSHFPIESSARFCLRKVQMTFSQILDTLIMILCVIFFNVGSMINNSIRECVFINFNLYTQVITNCKIICYIEYSNSKQREFIDMGKLRPLSITGNHDCEIRLDKK